MKVTKSGVFFLGALLLSSIPFISVYANNQSSPINLDSSIPESKLEPLSFSNIQEIEYIVSYHSHGSVKESAIQAVPSQEAKKQGRVPKMKLGNTEYTLDNIHWHRPSEHTRDDKYNDMEQHAVFKDAAGKIAVVGYFINVGNAESSHILSSFLRNAEVNVKGEELSIRVNVKEILRTSGKRFSYTGSLTTTPYTKGVKWNVFKDQLAIWGTDKEVLEKAIPTPNNRELQKIVSEVKFGR